MKVTIGFVTPGAEYATWEDFRGSAAEIVARCAARHGRVVSGDCAADLRAVQAAARAKWVRPLGVVTSRALARAE